MKITTLLLWCALVAPSVWAQIPEDEPPHELNALPLAPLVYLDDTVLTVGGFGDYLFNLGVHPTGQRTRDLDSLKSSLESFIDEVIVCRYLDSAAIMSDRMARRRARWRMAHRAGPLTYTHLLASSVSVSPEEVEQFYRDSLHTLFTAPSSREVRQILIAPRDEFTPDGKRVRGKVQWEAARQRTDSLKVAILAGASFDSLAAACSDDSSSRLQGGYLGRLYPGNTVYDFDTAAFAAQPGEIRGPVKTLYGYHLIRVDQIRPESTIALSDTVGLRIRRQIEFTKGRALGTTWADSVLNATRWRFNDSALERVPDIDTGQWLVTLNDRDTMWWEDWGGAWEMYRNRQKIEGPGTLEDKHASLKAASFPFLYLQVAEDRGFADDSSIVAEYHLFLCSEALRLEESRRVTMQQPPADLVDPRAKLEPETPPERPLHLQRLRAGDTATIWAAYRCLWAGDDIHGVARRFHDNMREIRSGTYDLGWVGPADLPAELWGKAWILEPGGFTRPIEYDSAFYILRLEERYQAQEPRERRNKEIDAIRSEYRRRGLEAWRSSLREGHRIRLDRSYWNRVQQLWRR